MRKRHFEGAAVGLHEIDSAAAKITICQLCILQNHKSYLSGWSMTKRSGTHRRLIAGQCCSQARHLRRVLF